MSEARLIAALPPDFSITLVDAGSAGGLHRRWRRWAPIMATVLFDPREAEARGAVRRGGSRIYPVALGAREGQAPLHLTALPNMSSLLEPDAASLARFHGKGRDATVVETTAMPLATLDALAAADRFDPDILKIDVQGAEHEVLAGGAAALARSIVFAEIEVSFFQRYRDQPLFADIEATMRDHGFELIDLPRLKRYRAASRAGLVARRSGRGERAGRLAYGDALFLLGEDRLIDRAARDGGRSLLCAIVALLAYGKVDLAARLLDLGADRIDSGLRDRIAATLPGFAGNAVRQAIGALGLFR